MIFTFQRYDFFLSIEKGRILTNFTVRRESRSTQIEFYMNNVYIFISLDILLFIDNNTKVTITKRR